MRPVVHLIWYEMNEWNKLRPSAMTIVGTQGIGAKSNVNLPTKLDHPDLLRSALTVADISTSASADHTFLALKLGQAPFFTPRILSNLSLVSRPSYWLS